MIVAMFLTKVRPSPPQRIAGSTIAQDLLLDWRLGEKWFMQNLIDGDLGSKYVPSFLSTPVLTLLAATGAGNGAYVLLPRTRIPR